jgi:hypothetical protein
VNTFNNFWLETPVVGISAAEFDFDRGYQYEGFAGSRDGLHASHTPLFSTETSSTTMTTSRTASITTSAPSSTMTASTVTETHNSRAHTHGLVPHRCTIIGTRWTHTKHHTTAAHDIKLGSVLDARATFHDSHTNSPPAGIKIRQVNTFNNFWLEAPDVGISAADFDIDRGYQYEGLAGSCDGLHVGHTPVFSTETSSTTMTTSSRASTTTSTPSNTMTASTVTQTNNSRVHTHGLGPHRCTTIGTGWTHTKHRTTALHDIKLTKHRTTAAHDNKLGSWCTMTSSMTTTTSSMTTHCNIINTHKEELEVCHEQSDPDIDQDTPALSSHHIYRCTLIGTRPSPPHSNPFSPSLKPLSCAWNGAFVHVDYMTMGHLNIQ